MDNISEYFSALVFYINQTNMLPDIVVFEYYGDVFDNGLTVPSETKLMQQSIEKIYDVLVDDKPWNNNMYMKALSIAFFVTLNSVDEWERNVGQIFNLLLEEAVKNKEQWKHSTLAFVDFAGRILKTKTYEMLPKRIGAIFRGFYEEIDKMLSR